MDLSIPTGMDQHRLVECKKLPGMRQNPTKAGPNSQRLKEPLGRIYGFTRLFGLLSVGSKAHRTFGF